MNEYRKCWICKIELLLNNDNFQKDKKDKYGFQKRCKNCNRITNKRFKDKNPDYFKDKSLEAYNKMKLQNPNYNVDRYSKYRNQYLQRRKDWSSSEYGALYNIFYAARSRSNKKNIEFDLKFEDILNMFDNQNGLCALTGLKLDTNTRKKENTNFYPYRPSIDKIDVTKGYTKNNIRIVSVITNLALNGFGDIVFDDMCKSYIKKKYGINV